MLCTIIGMGSGVSLGVGRRFAQEGFALAMVARNTEKLASMNLAEARSFAANAADEASLRSALEEIAKTMGATDVLIYNASASHMAKPSQLRIADLVSDFQVNVTGAVVAAQAVLPSMKAAGKGTIFFTGGGLALDPSPEYSSLAIGKAGIRNLAFSLAKECEPDGIHVATITISGFVQEGTRFAPEKIADEFWRLYRQDRNNWEREAIIR